MNKMKNKKWIFRIICFSCIVLIIGCERDDDTRSKEKLNLVSPNGNKIAKNIQSLYQIVSEPLISINGGMEIDFKITKIDYVPVTVGFAAIIECKFAAGRTMNLLFFPESSAFWKTIRLKNNNEQQPKAPYCEGSCPGMPPCQYVHFNAQFAYCSPHECEDCVLVKP